MMKTTHPLFLEAESINSWLVNVRRDFHREPELGMEEYQTQNKIIKYLKEMNIPYTIDIANTAVVGIIEGSKRGKTVALRADMDALPMEDYKTVDYKSTIKGKMHACGHDAHMTILLGAAKILKKKESNLKGTIKLLFQPAEETLGGAKPMIEAGVMKNPKVDAVFGLHVTPELSAGQIGVKYGQMNASSDTIHIMINGESTHGAYPHGGIDAIVIAGHIITALQTIVSRNVDPRESAVVTLGEISGGTQGNIVANRVLMKGTVRTLNPQSRDLVIEKTKKIIENIAISMGGSAELQRSEGYAALINDDHYVDLVKENAEEILGIDNVNIIKSPSLGVEDFAYFLQEAPGAFYRLGCRNEDKGIIHEGHSNLFDVDEDCLPVGVAMQVKNVLSVLEGE
ncbi:M20 metallopeptidase family protein [Alkaliphilus peptidifermentans]|uniref:Amidohydrolase n=1 Tax=Alkaliphilus peptidifermentans DSM 18978 TaxID=1120976 RepID=A0A1G5IV47_9FIRM|nr:M20 family metallopeptidase [Alkaliphilus peptidifermentans]SCY79936.1 amidohydrolase [Alkaliphilus peptidifermentans DSM 18978]